MPIPRAGVVGPRSAAAVVARGVACGLVCCLVGCEVRTPPEKGGAEAGPGGQAAGTGTLGAPDVEPGAATSAAPRDEKALARRVLDLAGVRGGLVVHVGCGDGKLTTALCASDGYLLHGLARTDADMASSRAHAASLGVYGKVSIDRLDGARLPYVDNLVNLVVSEDLGEVP
ncbi:MAG: class I SAM-dependent methyltransferase, partial [Planctomycetota bacterium]